MITELFFLLLAWSLTFEREEAAIDEAVSMDASDVGWGDTPAATTDDTGWATFDSFTDIRMAPSRFVLPLLKEAVNCSLKVDCFKLQFVRFDVIF